MCDKAATIVSLAYLGSGAPNDFSRAVELPNPTIHYSDEDPLLIRQQLQQRGLQWWTVDNGRQANLSDVVESLVERISNEDHYPSRLQGNSNRALL